GRPRACGGAIDGPGACPEGRRHRDRSSLDRGARGDGARGGAVRQITVFTHRRPEDTMAVLEWLAEQAANAGVTLRLDEEETRKHGLSPGPGVEVNAPGEDEVELCLGLGGDGTILRALQRYAGTGVPVFAINFGEIGFLATVEPEDVEDGIRRALSGDFELLRLPAIVLDQPGAGGGAAGTGWMAINDVAIHRKVGERVA